MNGIKAVLFDLDGTLVDSFKSIVIAFNAALEYLGADKVNESEIKEYIGTPHEVTIKKFSPEASDEQIKKSAEIFHKTRIKYTDEYTTAIDNSLVILKFLKNSGIKTAVVTTTGRDISTRILKKTGLYDYIDVLVSRDDVKKLKPDPEPVITALNKIREIGNINGRENTKENINNINKLNKENCIMIGDHPNDILAGKCAGIKTVGIVNVHSACELKSHGADYIVSNLFEIEQLIAGFLAD